MVTAVITTAGRGSRFGLLTRRFPHTSLDAKYNRNAVNKGMMTLCGRPLLWHVISSLKRAGIKDINIDRYYLGGQIENYFGNGKKMFGDEIKFKYSEDDLLGGTAASLRLVSKERSSVLVHYGDIIIDKRFKFKDLLTFHQNTNSDVTILVKRLSDIRRWGVINFLYSSLKIKGIYEKPFINSEKPVPGWCNCAVYVLSNRAKNRCLSYVDLKDDPQNMNNDFMRNIFPKLLKEGFSFYAFPMNYYWDSIDTPKQLFDLNWQALAGDIGIDIPGKLHKKGKDKIWIDGKPKIFSGAEIKGLAHISSGSLLRSGSVIKNAIIGSGADVSGNLENCIIPTPFGIINPDLPTISENSVIGQSYFCGGLAYNETINLKIAAFNGSNIVTEDLDLKPLAD